MSVCFGCRYLSWAQTVATMRQMGNCSLNQTKCLMNVEQGKQLQEVIDS